MSEKMSEKWIDLSGKVAILPVELWVSEKLL